jgi:ribulose-5-phosphate 4-epimerase/fuculose-1-phosphate aldolase
MRRVGGRIDTGKDMALEAIAAALISFRRYDKESHPMPSAKKKTQRGTGTRRAKPSPAAQARLDLAAALRWAARMGLNEGVCNHFSLEVPGAPDHYLVNPHALHWDEIRASDLIVVDGQGRHIEGRHTIEPTAFFIHSRLHRARPDAKCVLHTHMPYTTALTMVEGGRLEPCIQSALRFHGVIAYDRDVGGYNGLALDDAEGDRMAKALSHNRVLMLESHGVIVVGPNVAAAFDDLYYLERAAQAQVLAMSTGKRLKLVGDNTARVVQQQIERDIPVYSTNHFEALKRLLDRDAPDWRR